MARQGRFKFWRLATLLLTSAIASGLSSIARAHEGHAALPTKGAKIDVAKGLLTLSTEAHATLGVKTADAVYAEPDERVLAYASLVAPWQQHAFVTSRVSGRVAKVHVQAGQAVAAGQVLAEVESLNLETLQSEMVNTAAAVELSAKILDNLEPLAREQAIPEKDIFEARSKHEENISAAAIAKSKLLNLGFTEADIEQLRTGSHAVPMGVLPVVSPIAGTVTHVELTAGKIVDPSEHLAEIVDLTKVWAKIGVLERDLPRVKVGQPVELQLAAYPQRVLRASVTTIVPYLDADDHLGSVWAELANLPAADSQFLPGMYGQAQISVGKTGKLVAIPAAALLTDGAERFVLVEEAATARAFEYRKQNVVVALQTPTQVYLRGGGVFDGDRVITEGGHELATFFFSGVLKLSPEAILNAGIEVAPVTNRTIDPVIELEGVVEVPPENRVLLSTPIAGTLDRVLVDRGQPVSQGDAIAEIASAEFQDLQLEYLQFSLQAELSTRLLDRRRKLAETQNLAKRQFWETESQQKALVNKRETARRKLESLGVLPAQMDAITGEHRLLKTLTLRAPMDGIVVRFTGTLGEALKAQSPVFEIHNLDRVWVEGYLSERDVARVHVGQTARVRLVASPAVVLDGTVVRSGRVFGSVDRTLSVWVEIKNPSATPLQHNMLARLTLVGEPAGEANSTLPLAAIATEASRHYVFVKNDDGLFERRLVELGAADDRFVRIVNGVRDGDRVAIAGVGELQTAYASLR